MKKYLKEKLLKIPVIAIVLIIAIASCGNSSNWCVGKWTGYLIHLRNNNKVEYVIRINADHTCSVKSKWGLDRSADFEAEWEPVSDDVIKMYDYDGHNENWNGFNGIYQRRASNWTLYLKKDGSCSSTESGLNNPSGHLRKQ